MEKRAILRLVAEWQNRILRIKGIERDYESALLSMIGAKPIKIITGFRRSGKSFLAQRVTKKLVTDGTFSISNILYLNFEDFRLAGVNTPEKAYETYTTFRTEMANQSKKLLIFDEIQNVMNW
ncbi:MAG: AAA family ATPase, partial [Rhodospirillales bacterium]|nr:AAA family ATPase [Rhodospirillales bacterium]